MSVMLAPLDAARMIEADYAGSLDADARLDIDGCQAALVTRGHRAEKPILLIRGSDERLDWLRNFRFLPEASQGDRLWWHRGFLHHAQIAYAWAKGKGIGIAIGHSLGAACVQIVATSLGVPGLGIASPQALFAPMPTSPRPENEDLVRNWCRLDDTVCYLPPDGFSHVGAVQWLEPPHRHLGQDHSIRHYIELMGRLP